MSRKSRKLAGVLVGAFAGATAVLGAIAIGVYAKDKQTYEKWSGQIQDIVKQYNNVNKELKERKAAIETEISQIKGTSNIGALTSEIYNDYENQIKENNSENVQNIIKQIVEISTKYSLGYHVGNNTYLNIKENRDLIQKIDEVQELIVKSNKVLDGKTSSVVDIANKTVNEKFDYISNLKSYIDVNQISFTSNFVDVTDVSKAYDNLTHTYNDQLNVYNGIDKKNPSQSMNTYNSIIVKLKDVTDKFNKALAEVSRQSVFDDYNNASNSYSSLMREANIASGGSSAANTSIDNEIKNNIKTINKIVTDNIIAQNNEQALKQRKELIKRIFGTFDEFGKIQTQLISYVNKLKSSINNLVGQISSSDLADFSVSTSSSSGTVTSSFNFQNARNASSNMTSQINAINESEISSATDINEIFKKGNDISTKIKTLRDGFISNLQSDVITNLATFKNVENKWLRYQNHGMNASNFVTLNSISTKLNLFNESKNNLPATKPTPNAANQVISNYVLQAKNVINLLKNTVNFVNSSYNEYFDFYNNKLQNLESYSWTKTQKFASTSYSTKIREAASLVYKRALRKYFEKTSDFNANPENPTIRKTFVDGWVQYLEKYSQIENNLNAINASNINTLGFDQNTMSTRMQTLNSYISNISDQIVGINSSLTSLSQSIDAYLDADLVSPDPTTYIKAYDDSVNIKSFVENLVTTMNKYTYNKYIAGYYETNSTSRIIKWNQAPSQRSTLINEADTGQSLYMKYQWNSVDNPNDQFGRTNAGTGDLETLISLIKFEDIKFNSVLSPTSSIPTQTKYNNLLTELDNFYSKSLSLVRFITFTQQFPNMNYSNANQVASMPWVGRFTNSSGNVPNNFPIQFELATVTGNISDWSYTNWNTSKSNIVSMYKNFDKSNQLNVPMTSMNVVWKSTKTINGKFSFVVQYQFTLDGTPYTYSQRFYFNTSQFHTHYYWDNRYPYNGFNSIYPN